MSRIVKHRGRIVRREQGRTVVRVDAVGGEHCRACGLCRMIGDEEILFSASVFPDVKEGDEVEVEIVGRKPLAYALLIFGLPLGALLGGIFGGRMLAQRVGWLSHADAIGFAIGMFLVVASAAVLVLLDKRFPEKRRPSCRIVRVTRRGTTDPAP